MKRKRLWTILACSAGAVVGLYLFAAYSNRHPQSWAGRATHRLCRVIYPRDPNFRPLGADPEPVAAAPQADLETEIADRTSPKIPSPAPVIAPPDVGEILEPIVIGPPVLDFRAGTEESEFPIIIDLPPQRRLAPPSPSRMHNADEPPAKTSAPTPGLWSSLVTAPWNAALSLGLAVFPVSDPNANGATLGPIEPLGAATAVEESAVPAPMPADHHHHHHHHHCPYTGGRCLPNHYRQFEIPAVQPTMPAAPDTPAVAPSAALSTESARGRLGLPENRDR